MSGFFAIAVAIVALGLSAAGFGMAISRALRLEFDDRLEQLAIILGLGTVTLSVVTFAVAAAGVLRRPVLVAPVAAGIVLAALMLRRGPIAPAGARAPAGLLRTMLLALIAVCAIVNFIGALAPPSFIDALLYHLFEAREYLRAGRLIPIPHAWQSFQPIGVEMLYTLAMGLTSDRLAPVVDFGLGLLAALGTAVLARRLCGALGGIIAAALFYCTAMVAWQTTSCFVEPGVAAAATLGLHALLRWNQTERRGWLLAAALMLGFAASCKLTAAQLPLYALILLVYLSLARRPDRRRSPAAAAKAALLFGLVSLALVAPWYLRSWLWTGNPVYPFMPSLFGANNTNSEVQQVLAIYGSGHGLGDLLMAPWRLLSHGEKFESGESLSPLPFLLAPVILWRARRPGERQGLLIVAACWFLVWLGTAQIARYLVPIQPIAATLAADALVVLLGSMAFRRRLALAACMLFPAFGTLGTLLYDAQFVPVVMGRETEQAYLARTSWFYVVHQDLGRELPPKSRVLTSEGPTYYLDVPHDCLRRTEFLAGPEHVGQVLEAGHFTHILIYADPELEAQMARLAPRVRPVWRRNYDLPRSRTFGGSLPTFAALYEVVPEPEAAAPPPAPE